MTHSARPRRNARQPRTLLDRLDADQRALCRRRTPLIALSAPPGTGKTATLVARFLSLVLKRTDPQRILMATFTTRAQSLFAERLAHATRQCLEHHPKKPPELHTLSKTIESMQLAEARGLRHLTDLHAPPPLWIGTFHFLAGRITRNHLERIGLTAPLQIAGGQEMRVRMRQALLDEQALPPDPNEHPRAIANACETLRALKLQGLRPAIKKENGQVLTGFAGVALPGATPQCPSPLWSQAFKRYQQRLAREGRVDLDDLIGHAWQLLSEHQDIRHAWQSRFDHVLVDECQDTDPMLLHLVRLLAPRSEIVVAGDPNQSIYGWRNAIENFTALDIFKETHGTPILHALHNDWRLPQPIQEAANRLRTHLAAPGPTPNSARHPGWAPPRHETAPDETALALRLGIAIRATLRDYGGPDTHPGLDPDAARPSRPADVLILARTHHVCTHVATRLVQDDFRVYLASQARQTPAVHALLAWLAACASPTNSAIERAFCAAPFLVAPELLSTPLDLARARGIPLYHALIQLKAESGPHTKHQPQLHESLHAPLETLCGALAVRGADPARAARRTVEHLIHTLELESTAEADAAALRDYRETISLARSITHADPRLEELSAALCLENTPDECPPDHIAIRTMHSSKGLEARHVFTVDWAEGEFPPQYTTDVNAERKLAFTALTRAQRTFCSMSARKTAQGYPRRPSRFVHEARLPIIDHPVAAC